MTVMRKILVPVDFSTPEREVIEVATTLAKENGATLLIVHVEEPPPAYGGGELYYGQPDPSTEALKDMLVEVKPSLEGVPCEHRLIMGDPASAIVQLAEAEQVDMIVMSTHGRTGVGRLLLGSVAETVVRRAECPVMTLRQPRSTAA